MLPGNNTILSLQSHVVFGYVGNRAIQAIMNYLRYNLDTVNLIQFSNHTGYENHNGEIINPKELESILASNRECHFNYNGYLLGYLSNNNNLQAIRNYLHEIYKPSDKKSILLLDPVMGDDNLVYVEQNIIEEYRATIKCQQLTNNLVLTPNLFELQILTGNEEKLTKDLTLDDMLAMSDQVFSLKEKNNLKMLVITSLNDLHFKSNTNTFDSDEYIYTLCITPFKKYLFKVPKYDTYFTGVGDMFSALLLYSLLELNAMSKLNDDKLVIQCIDFTLYFIHQFLKTTLENRNLKLLDNLNLNDVHRDPILMKDYELKILKAIRILKPKGVKEAVMEKSYFEAII
ncbi:hypothetical protein QEN19_003430 [Hanseniaspora menglaensis]